MESILSGITGYSETTGNWRMHMAKIARTHRFLSQAITIVCDTAETVKADLSAAAANWCFVRTADIWRMLTPKRQTKTVRCRLRAQRAQLSSPKNARSEGGFHRCRQLSTHKRPTAFLPLSQIWESLLSVALVSHTKLRVRLHL